VKPKSQIGMFDDEKNQEGGEIMSGVWFNLAEECADRRTPAAFPLCPSTGTQPTIPDHGRGRICMEGLCCLPKQ
jgi:hypothetical protein